MQHLNYVLCDLGIISRCSAATAMPCKRDIDHLLFNQILHETSDTTRTMPLCSPLKYLHRKHFVVVYPFGRATKISLPLIVSEKTSTCFSFKSSYFLPLLANNSPLIHCGMLASNSTLRLVVMVCLTVPTFRRLNPSCHSIHSTINPHFLSMTCPPVLNERQQYIHCIASGTYHLHVYPFSKFSLVAH